MTDIKPENIFGVYTWVNATLWVLAAGGFVSVVAGLITTINASGLISTRLAKWVARNRFEDTLKALEQMGVRVRWDDKPRSLVGSAIDQFKEPAYLEELGAMLRSDTYTGNVHIGEGRHSRSEGFIDVIGATTNVENAQRYAQYINTHRLKKGLSDFDMVATPKSGSPILGYEFSRLTNTPLILGKQPGTGSKIRDDNNVLGAHLALDFPKGFELKGKRALLVDDSTTGGSKLLKLAEALRAADAKVTHALVLFEPQGKEARKALLEQKIELVSVTMGPSVT